MVREQIIRRGISNNQVIDVMQNTPRHRFVPDGVADYAYQDNALPIGKGQTISQPYIVAFMTETLDVDSTYKVLEIGTGSGYQAAVLSPLVKHVYTIEIVRSLAEGAGELLKTLGYDNVTVKWGDGYEGWVEHAPFDCVIVTAAPVQVPKALIEQLKIGGRMVIPMGSFYQELKVFIKEKDGIEEESIIPVRFVPMVHPTQSIPSSSP
jgi:protein-L-isoaspartate(D-aspartate) O-methyltransferase